MSSLLELGAGRRASLGKFGRKQDTRYLVDDLPDGTIILRPATVMTESQAKLLARPDVQAEIDAAYKNPDDSVDISNLIAE